MSVFEPAWAAAPMSKFSSPVQRVALAVGAVFLAVGVLDLVPGITTHHGRLTFAGHHFGAALRGIFNVSVLHGLVHLASASPVLPHVHARSTFGLIFSPCLYHTPTLTPLAAPGAGGRHDRPRRGGGPHWR